MVTMGYCKLLTY